MDIKLANAVAIVFNKSPMKTYCLLLSSYTQKYSYSLAIKRIGWRQWKSGSGLFTHYCLHTPLFYTPLFTHTITHHCFRHHLIIDCKYTQEVPLVYIYVYYKYTCIYIYVYFANCVISGTQWRKFVSIRVHILIRVQNRV